ncbi:MAG TPA: 1,4-dihydroxy-6-naphthoate synthase [Puia sp.]|jgi:1,4-dihydroxy-6-naphthoate synthase|nr:1,4-dihydroxy-6-naphthoate synthase [Puia sp.]
MRFSLGFSPCPNDTFIFDALVNRKLSTEGFDFEVVLEDVQTLNQWALQGKLDITKISYGALPLVLNDYNLLDSGGALGKGVGPLLISKKQMDVIDINECSVAIPGKNTTAHLLFSLAFPQATKKRFMIFSDIEQAVLGGEVDAGVIIHENRFTYLQKGLIKLVDLGDFWEKETGGPIPLGGIVIKKGFDIMIQQQVNELIKKSVGYAFKHYPVLSPFVKQHSQEMDEIVMRQHIDLYVNNYSISLGEHGKNAVKMLLRTYSKMNAGEITRPIHFIE